MTDLRAPGRFQTQFARFQRLIADNNKGNAFTNFQEGVAGVWEGYRACATTPCASLPLMDGRRAA
jgi:hypothetical protein